MTKADCVLCPLVIGESVAMSRAVRLVHAYAGLPRSVIFVGPIGSGKSMLASQLHARSSNRAGPLVELPVGEVPDTLYLSKLFGHRRGAFTDAVHDVKGAFELAAGGTLVLDDFVFL